MLYTEQSARANIRNREGRRVFYLASGDQLTPGARDWLRQEKIDILPASEARPERFELLGGGYIEEKPEHMTHLNSQVLVDKTHPRIAFRGALDTLEAELILCQLVLEKELAQMVGEVLELARQIIRCDVLEEPLISEKLCGLTENERAFHVISAGRNPPNPMELLSSTRMEQMLALLRRNYDYIILDLPPVGEVGDALAVAKMTDGMLRVVRQNYCNRLALGAAIRQFAFVDSRILGIVYNCTDEGGNGYSRKYYKKYGKNLCKECLPFED